ncbi:MAG: polysaccharide deacetylase family protein, partial [Deltaproteobacteria bacterium]|nr:polysaccharide deacetylase family protein [Deltaproteobacteria bacterium]
LTGYTYITVLLYHKFDEADSPSTSVSSAMFMEQMEYLSTRGYKVLSIRKLADCINGKATIPAKGVVITIDDGYISAYTKAVPILRRFNYPFTVFIASGAVGSRRCMSWEQLKELKRDGADIGCHSLTHPHLVDISEQEIEKEIILSKKIMEDNLGYKIEWFAYPFGEYDEYIRSAGIRAGYTLLMTSDPGSVGKETLLDIVPRQAIVGRNMTMKRFREKLNQPPLLISERIPPPGRLKSNTIRGVRITIKNPDQYQPDQVQMFLSEKGRLSTVFDPVTGRLLCKDVLILNRKVNRIIITARRKQDNNYAMRSYMIVLPRDKGKGQ